jgi:hypothetical protein
MASRFATFIAAIETDYSGADDTMWFVGANHIHDHHNWNRIVAWLGDGPVVGPETAAQGITTDESGRDDIVWTRKPRASIGIWAQNEEQAENRLHAILVSLDNILAQADITISSLSEVWIAAQNQDNTSDGQIVVLSFDVSFNVLAHDADIVAYDAASAPTPPRPTVGQGGPTEVVTSVDITADNDEGDDLPTVTVTEE